MAVPSAVAKSAVTPEPLGAESVTGNSAVVVPALPSVTATSPIVRSGDTSLSRMVAVWFEMPPTVPPTGLVRLAPKVSSASSTASSRIVTLKLWVDPFGVPAGKFSVPALAL